jgi:hypothetical protein
MVNRIGYYWTALYLTAAIALAECMALILVSANLADVRTFAYRAVAALAIAFGLWVHSHAARYLGALWFLISAWMMIWALVSRDTIVFSFALVCIVALVGLSVTTACILLVSRQFAEEFRGRRETESRYKRTLRTAAHIAVVALVVIATVIEIYAVPDSRPQ